MRVLMTAEVLRFPATGIQRYVRELAAGLARREDVELTLLAESAEHVARIDAQVKLHSSIRRHCRYLWGPLPDMSGYDIVHCPHPVAPFFRKPRGPKLVMTMHDLIPLVAPEHHNCSNRLWFRRVLPWQLPLFDHFIAVSESTRQDMLRVWAMPADRVSVVHLGPRWSPAEHEVVYEKQDYLLAVGTLEPRKNLSRVVEAFVEFKSRHPDAPDVLKIVGGRGWERQDLFDLIDKHEHEVQLLGFLSDDELVGLYRRAKGLIYPSLYEGFGLPVLEAMALGCPVITSDRSSLPEVGGDAVLYVEPESVASIAGAIEQLAMDAALRRRLTSAGLDQAAQFSWDRCAAETAAVYQSLLK